MSLREKYEKEKEAKKKKKTGVAFTGAVAAVVTLAGVILGINKKNE